VALGVAGQHNRPERFVSSYSGPLHVIISSSDNKNFGNQHPVKLGKIFIYNFNGITNISPKGSQRNKISFDSLVNVNNCLSSLWLPLNNNHIAPISSTLIYSLNVIRLDQCVSEEDFWDGWECCYKIIEFKRINVKRDGVLVPTNLVELKFLSPKLSDKLLVFKIIHPASPNIPPSVQCFRCLRFAHTQKFCRGQQPCNHCSDINHSIASCEKRLLSSPQCFNFKLDKLLPTDPVPSWLRKKSSNVLWQLKTSLMLKPRNNILLISDSQSCLLALSYDLFNSFLSPLVPIIKSLVYRLNTENKVVQFLWVPSYVDDAVNKGADYLAFSTKHYIHRSPFKTPASNRLLPTENCFVMHG